MHRSQLLLLAINIAISMLFVYVPFVFRDIINQISKFAENSANVDNGLIYKSLIILGVVFAAEQVLMFVNEKVSDNLRIKTITTLRQRVFPKLMDLSIDYIEKMRPGALAQKVNQGIYDLLDWIWQLNEWLSTVIFSSIFILIVLLINNV